MNTPPGELVSHAGASADDAREALQVLFMDVGPEDQATLETLRPRSWWLRFVPDTQLDADDGAAALAQRLHGTLTRERLLKIAIVPDARLQEGVDRASRRIALALVTLGLYIASSLPMQHAAGPQWGGMPPFALAGYALAIRFTFSIARGRPLR